MKTIRYLITITLVIFLMTFTGNQARAQIPGVGVVTGLVKRVIKAIDLKIQRMQNQTIWLQNAQKQIENELSKLRLTEISGWSSDQQKLFSDYYSELWEIKSAIAYYQRIKDVTLKQAALVSEYQHAWTLFRQDSHFNAGELDQMQKVYTGILNDSVKNMDELMTVVTSGRTQMTDEQRMELLNQAGDRLDDNYDDLHRYNQQNQILSLQRSRDIDDIQSTRQLYGIH